MKMRAGFTLMELLVVLLIIGVLSTVAVRTIDATRNRALFDQTAAEMRELVSAVVGNPDLTMDGRRVDFGYFGDLGEMPGELRDLVTNEGNDPRWKGPYLRKGFLGDSVGYLHDAWGNPYTYDRETGVIATLGDGKYPMTVRVADTLVHLNGNSIVGTVADMDNNPPGDASPLVFLELSSGVRTSVGTDPGGYYSFDNVPIGTHKLVAWHLYDSITRWVSVAPRTRNVVDFRFNQPFRGFLQLVGSAQVVGEDSSSFLIDIVNVHEIEVNVSSVTFLELGLPEDTAFFRAFTWQGVPGAGYPLGPTEPGFGRRDTMPFNGTYTVQGRKSEVVTVGFWYGRSTRFETGDTVNIAGWPVRLRFSEGSTVEFTLPTSGP
ncbi:MAG: prepilin-type N-terminal cleavage/methylation domain-containing protein [bacterium]